VCSECIAVFASCWWHWVRDIISSSWPSHMMTFTTPLLIIVMKCGNAVKWRKFSSMMWSPMIWFVCESKWFAVILVLMCVLRWLYTLGLLCVTAWQADWREETDRCINAAVQRTSSQSAECVHWCIDPRRRYTLTRADRLAARHAATPTHQVWLRHCRLSSLQDASCIWRHSVRLRCELITRRLTWNYVIEE